MNHLVIPASVILASVILSGAKDPFSSVILSGAKDPFSSVILRRSRRILSLPLCSILASVTLLAACVTTESENVAAVPIKVSPAAAPVIEDPLAPAVLERDAMTRLDDMGPQGLALKNNANQRKAFIEDLRRTRALAIEAVKAGVDKDPVFTQRLEAQREHLLANMYVDSVLKSKTSEAALRKYFKNNRATFEKHQRSAFHIVTKEESAARAAISALREPGVNLETLVEEFAPSEPEGAKSGDLGTFARGQMLKPLEDAVFVTNVGQVYPEPVKTEFGWHAILVTGDIPPKPVKFEDVRDDVAQKYRSELHRQIVAKSMIR